MKLIYLISIGLKFQKRIFKIFKVKTTLKKNIRKWSEQFFPNRRRAIIVWSIVRNEENIEEQFPFRENHIENRWDEIKNHALSYEGVRFKIIVRYRSPFVKPPQQITRNIYYPRYWKPLTQTAFPDISSHRGNLRISRGNNRTLKNCKTPLPLFKCFVWIKHEISILNVLVSITVFLPSSPPSHYFHYSL